MDNTDQNYEAFLQGLMKLADYFCDAMTPSRMQSYWELLAWQVSLEEWDYACYQAMLQETFYKVPLVSVLLDYARNFRKEQRQAERQRQLEARQPFLSAE